VCARRPFNFGHLNRSVFSLALGVPFDCVFVWSVDILQLLDPITSLYDRALLVGDIDNSELDALKRLASSQASDTALLGSSEETIPELAFTIVPCSSGQLSENTAPATTVPFLADYKMQVAQAPPSIPKAAKLLLPDSSTSATKHRSAAGQNPPPAVSRCGGLKSDRVDRGDGKPLSMKRRDVSTGGQKSAPLGDVMNVKLAGDGPPPPPRLVSLVPLSLVATTKQSPLWNNEQVTVKLEPGVTCPRVAKRKLHVEPGMLPLSRVSHFCIITTL